MKDVEIELESELDLETKGCSELFNFRKLLSKEEKLSAIISKAEDLLTLGLYAHLNHQQNWAKHLSLAFKNDV